MTQKDKQLLLKDLCARLPYHPILRWTNCDGKSIDEELKDLSDVNIFFISKSENNEVKPYLRPIESITEEEYKKLSEVYNHGESHHVVLPQNDERHHATLCMISNGTIDDWLNAHHFDYRGLIPMGLALEAKEGMYKTE